MEKYLSATVVQEKLKELCEKYFVQYGSHYDSFGKAIAEFTENLPEADVKENVRGEWEEDEFGTKCSNCKKYTHLDRFGRPMRFLFCSMCGARMEV